MNQSEFMRGVRDCRDGEPHKPNQSDDYDKGFNYEYQAEANVTAKTELREAEYGLPNTDNR